MTNLQLHIMWSPQVSVVWTVVYVFAIVRYFKWLMNNCSCALTGPAVASSPGSLIYFNAHKSTSFSCVYWKRSGTRLSLQPMQLRTYRISPWLHMKPTLQDHKLHRCPWGKYSVVWYNYWCHNTCMQYTADMATQYNRTASTDYSKCSTAKNY